MPRPTGLLALAAGLSVAAGCGKAPPPIAPPDAPTVTVRHPETRAYAPTKEFTGRLDTKDPVKVVPRVSGMLLRRLFKDGDPVVKDKTVLFEIDPAQFAADLKKAKADVAKAVADGKNWAAQIELAKVDLARVTSGFKKGGIAETDVDKAKATLDVNTAQLDVAAAAKDAALAAQDKAAENLGYCTILAPTTGRARRALVAERSVVDAYKTELVEVDPVAELYAVWDVDELTSLWYREQIARKEIPDPLDENTRLRCRITLRDGRTFPPPDRPGVPVDFIDPEIVRSTGTRTIRATFPNPDKFLSAGDSVVVRVDAGRPRPVLTVPETAVFAQQNKRYVYVLGGEDKVALREVTPGPSFDGVVEVNPFDPRTGKGLATADRVIVDNLLRVRPGAKVQVQK